MYMKYVRAVLPRASRQQKNRAQEEQEDAPEIVPFSSLVDEPPLDSIDVHASNAFATRLVGSHQGNDVDVVAAPGQSFGVAHNTVIAVIERVGNHRDIQRSASLGAIHPIRGRVRGSSFRLAW